MRERLLVVEAGDERLGPDKSELLPTSHEETVRRTTEGAIGIILGVPAYFGEGVL